MTRGPQRGPDELPEVDDFSSIWSFVTSHVRRLPSKRSCETAILALPLLRLKRPPVETRTAGSFALELLHCELVLESMEPELLLRLPVEPMLPLVPGVPLLPLVAGEPLGELPLEPLSPDEDEPDVEPLPVTLDELLSPELPASEDELAVCMALASWRVACVSITTSSIEPSFSPLRS